MKRLTWKIDLTIAIDESWVAQGFVPDECRIRHLIEDELLMFTMGPDRKVTVEIKEAPHEKTIKRLQGVIED